MKLPRNWLAIHAHHRTGAGSHGDKAKSNNKGACRASTQDYLDEWYEELEDEEESSKESKKGEAESLPSHLRAA